MSKYTRIASQLNIVKEAASSLFVTITWRGNTMSHRYLPLVSDSNLSVSQFLAQYLVFNFSRQLLPPFLSTS
jgi:hypothetical protein